MSGIDLLLDTNVVIDFLSGEAQTVSSIRDALERGQAVAVSQITRIEILSHPDLPEDEWERVNAFLGRVPVLPLSDRVEKHAIEIRRGTRLKLPDAINLATATANDCTLVTNDKRLLKTDLPGLKVERSR